ncbi:uncharacterized protein LOC112637990 [Camponotus floridanus]|nr:uncharacterized protein LOC112637990 [Camponotus floridanus]
MEAINRQIQRYSSSPIFIDIDPSSFSPRVSSFSELRKEWFVNLSSSIIPEVVQLLLQLGEKFCLPVVDKERTVVDLLKSVEFNINKLPTEVRTLVRNRSFPIINSFHNSILHKSPSDKVILKSLNATKKFTRDNPDILFTRADKGNITVALNKDDYLSNMSVLLADENTYKVVNKSPIKKLTSNLHDLLVRWRSRDYISVAKYRSLNCTDGVLPRAYGLPKIHKKNNPLRIIVSSKNTPLYGLAKFLHDIIYKSVPRPDSQVINSAQVVDRLNGRRIDDNIKLISLDVISLFTNIPLDLAIDSLSNRWDYIGGNCQIPRDEFLTAVRFVLNSTFFMFNGVCYQQTFGTPMGSPLSPIIAEITLRSRSKI